MNPRTPLRQLKIARPLHLLRRPSRFGDVFPSHGGPGWESSDSDDGLFRPHPGWGWGLSEGLLANPDHAGVGLGYRCDVPDRRDFTPAVAQRHLAATHAKAIKKSLLLSSRSSRLPSSIDCIRWLAKGRLWPVEQQGPLYSCTAHAATSLIEYLLRHATGRMTDLSRLFLYKVTRTLEHSFGDAGATLRGTFRAIDRFGIPPEEYWRYDLPNFDVEPSAFLYSFASNYGKLLYTRLDEYGKGGSETLDAVKRALADGLPVAFGFPVYSSVTTAADIPVPQAGDRLLGGHAVLAVGYDDQREGGSIVVRNSWGPRWGDEGYGYLPYQYIREQWATDFWTVFRAEWLHPENLATPAAERLPMPLA